MLVLNDIDDRSPGGDWARGRVVPLGDAVHPMTPALGQGAGMAVEDALVLAACLDEARDMLPALSAYAAQRATRTAVAVELSRRKGPAGDRTAFSTQDPRLAELFAWVPSRLPDAASSLVV